MRVGLITLLLPVTLTFSSVIPSKFIRTWTDNAVIRSIAEVDYPSYYGGLIKRMSGGNCHAVRIKEGICPREAMPQRPVLDPSHTPSMDCFRDTICCGDGCNGLNIVGPAPGGRKRDLMPEQSERTAMEEPNMKPLVKRQTSLPQAGQQVIIYQNGKLLDQKYAGLFTCKLPGADAAPPPSPPPPPAPSAVRETIFHIGYFREASTADKPPGSYVQRHKAAVFANNSPGIGAEIACDDPPASLDRNYSPGERPKFPQKIRFDSAGRKGCEYNRLGDGDAGGLNCDGLLAKCNKVSGEPDRVECEDDEGRKKDPWRTQVTCIF